MGPTIVATDLSKVYRTYKKRSGLSGALRGLVHRDFEETRAVDRVSFSIEQGEFVGFLGPNGAGKSTVVNMIRGLLVPDEGTILLRGTDIVKNMQSARKYLGGKICNTQSSMQY